MNLFDKLKEFGKKQIKQIDYDEYDKTKDRELLNLRRLRRQQLEKLEKEKLKKEIAEHNRLEEIAFNKGLNVSDLKKKIKNDAIKNYQNLKKEAYKRTKSNIKNIKARAKRKYKKEWYIKKPIRKVEEISFFYQNFFKEQPNKKIRFI